jgi:hypothetical protein
MDPLKTLSVVFIPFVFLFSACSEEDEFKPYLKGDIVGYAFCFDEYGSQLEDLSGIKVFIEPGRKYSAITNEDGKYVLKNVINGTYDMSFEKEGFGTMKLHSVKHLGGYPTVMDYYDAPFICQYITTQITNLEFVNDSIRVSVSFSSQYKPYLIQLRLFFSTEENFSIESVQATKNMNLFEYYDYAIYRSYISVTECLPFGHGNKVYYKACIYTVPSAQMVYNNYYINGTDTYFDYDNNRIIYPNLSNESGAFSFIMP